MQRTSNRMQATFLYTSFASGVSNQLCKVLPPVGPFQGTNGLQACLKSLFPGRNTSI